MRTSSTTSTAGTTGGGPGARRGHAVLAVAGLLGCATLLMGACGGEEADTSASASPGSAAMEGVVTVVEEPVLDVARAADLARPTGPVLLTITGGQVTNVGDRLELDRALLEQLGTVSLTVRDEQATGGEHEFTGPLMADVLELAGAEGATTMHATAVNDYKIDVPVSDATDLPLLLATEMDGEPMSVEDYGPLRFVYPDEALGLDPAVYDARWVWQLVELDLR